MVLVRKIALVALILSIFITTVHASDAMAPQYHLAVGNLDRTYLLYRPIGLIKQKSVPLVIVLHGGFGLGQQAERSYDWDVQADAHGFIVAYPDGIGRSWNAGGNCCGPALRDNVDDVAFITQLINTIISSEHIDTKRVYLVGMSNGAAMSYRYACEGDYPLAAIGSVSGSLSTNCERPRPISVIEIHGLNDQNIPFGGGQGSKGVAKVQWFPVQKTLDTFRRVNSCGKDQVQKSGVLQTVITDCAAGKKVKLVAIEGAGHQWPGRQSRTHFVDKLLDIDPPSEALDATSTLWRFFQNQHI